jgi:PKD repeat protein
MSALISAGFLISAVALGQPTPPRLTVTMSSQTGAPLQFRLLGDPDQFYVLEATTDFANWTAIATNFTDHTGVASVSDPQSSQFPARFYRARLLHPPGITLDDPEFRRDRILVKPLPGVDLALVNELTGTLVLQTFPAIDNLKVLQVPAGTDPLNLVAIYQQSGLVEYAEPDYIVHALLAPNDLRYVDGTLWGLHNTGIYGGTLGADIHAPDAWDVQNSANSIVVAVVDTGVRYTHEDLAANMWVNPADGSHGTNALAGTTDPNDDHGHGTHVAGTLGAVGNNELGVVGVAWRLQIMACKFLDSQGNGSLSDAIACIDYARTHGAKIINASWGSTTFTSQGLHDAIASARNAGIIFVGAAGNAGANDDVTPLFPACYDLDNILSVAATTRTDDLATFSNYGPTNVDLGAPGAAIFSTGIASDSDYSYLDGSSFAAAHVSGACAVVWAHFPTDNYQQVINRVLSGVDPLPSLAGKCRTGGRLNLAKALGTVSTGVTVTVTASDPDASETGPDPGVIRFHRTGDTSQPLPVSWTFSGTAVNGSDYQQLPTTGTIPAGQADADLTITPIDDNIVEGPETVIVTVVSGPGYSAGSPSSATVTIADNDQATSLPVVTVTAVDPNASEAGPDPGVVRFHRTGDTSQPLPLSWTFSGTAVNGSDYQQLPTTGNIPAGQADADLTITPIDDTAVEGPETVVVTLASGSGYTAGSPNSATVTIADNDQAGPTANFTANPTSGQVPLTVQFTDTSTGTISVWDWNFGDGSAHSSAQNPSHTYNSAGNFTVTLTVTGSGGSSSKSATITATTAPPPPPVANFSASPTSGQAPLTVQFTDQSTGSISTWDWNFGDGSAHSSAQNPSHTYNSAGNFTVTLTVTGSGGSSSKSATITATTAPPPPPVANFSASPTSGQAPLTVQFTDQSTGSISTWDWNFGDGSAHSSAQNPSHTYNSAGNFTVTLSVTGSGGSSSKSATITVTAPPPPPTVASFSASPTSGQAPLTVQFTDQSTGSISTWDWNFGDGSAHSSARSPSHTYNSAGTFTVTLTVTGSGGSDSASATITVTTPPPPVANFSANPTSGQAPLTVQFTDQSTGSISTWDWNFGDGSAHSSARSPSHTYNSAGTFTVTLTVTGSGGSNSKSATITITAPPPVANFSANPTSGQAPLTVQFTDQSTGSISTWDWNFGDGSAHSSARSPSHTYNSAGTFTVTLTVTGSGGSSSKSMTISVSAPPPPLSANFTASPLLGIVPLVVQFTDTSTGNPVSWSWNFGDGSGSTAQNPSHIYVLPGTYTVTLTVRNSAGATSSKSATITATLL